MLHLTELAWLCVFYMASANPFLSILAHVYRAREIVADFFWQKALAQFLHNHMPPVQVDKIDIAQSTSRWMVRCDCAMKFSYGKEFAQSHCTTQQLVDCAMSILWFCAGGMCLCKI